MRSLPGYDPRESAAGFHFNEESADLAVGFFRDCLTHVKGARARTPFLLEPWQRAAIGNLFGWQDAAGYRRYREAFIYVPRKNGKTPMAAGILLQLLFRDNEPGAEIYGAAHQYQQACLVFEQARGMVMQCPALSKRAQVFNGQLKSIVLRDGFSAYRVISAEGLAAHGQNAHAAVIDELHTQKDRELVDTLTTGMASADRKQPLLIHITTADYARESICNEKYEYAKKVRDGIIDDPSFLPVIYEASRDDDWTDETVWEKANPNLDVSVSREFLRRECAKAAEMPAYQNAFKRLHLNMQTEQDVRWIGMDLWDACCGSSPDLSGRRCYAGLDLSSTTDLSALVLVFPDDGGVFHVEPHFWVPGDNVARRERDDRVPYSAWISQGALATTPGNVVDYDRIRAEVQRLGKRYNIVEVAVDRWNSTQLQTQLMGDGFEVVKFGQGFASMTAPTKKLEELLLAKRLRHGGHPVLRWNASNVAAQMDAAGNIKPDKAKSTERIDGVVALIMALGRALVSPGAESSVYDSRGILEL